jgi:hypothetical protein
VLGNWRWVLAKLLEGNINTDSIIDTSTLTCQHVHLVHHQCCCVAQVEAATFMVVQQTTRRCYQHIHTSIQNLSLHKKATPAHRGQLRWPLLLDAEHTYDCALSLLHQTGHSIE